MNNGAGYGRGMAQPNYQQQQYSGYAQPQQQQWQQQDPQQLQYQQQMYQQQMYQQQAYNPNDPTGIYFNQFHT